MKYTCLLVLEEDPSAYTTKTRLIKLIDDSKLFETEYQDNLRPIVGDIVSNTKEDYVADMYKVLCVIIIDPRNSVGRTLTTLKQYTNALLVVKGVSANPSP